MAQVDTAGVMLAKVLTAPAPQLTYLEDPDVGSSALEVMITATAAASLNMYCRGGDGCCGREDTRWGAAAGLPLAIVSRLC